LASDVLVPTVLRLLTVKVAGTSAVVVVDVVLVSASVVVDVPAVNNYR